MHSSLMRFSLMLQNGIVCTRSNNELWIFTLLSIIHVQCVHENNFQNTLKHSKLKSKLMISNFTTQYGQRMRIRTKNKIRKLNHFLQHGTPTARNFNTLAINVMRQCSFSTSYQMTDSITLIKCLGNISKCQTIGL